GLPGRCPWRVLGRTSLAHGGPGIEELCDWLIARTGATPEVIGVAIEMTQGPLVEALLERGFCVYGINPKQLDRFRDRFTVAGAKDDRREAQVLADSLRTIGTRFGVCQTTNRRRKSRERTGTGRKKPSRQ